MVTDSSQRFSASMRQAVQDLANAKDRLDVWLRRRSNEAFSLAYPADWPRGQVVHPQCFMRAVIPFFWRTKEETVRVMTDVDPRMIIGSPIKGYGEEAYPGIVETTRMQVSTFIETGKWVRAVNERWVGPRPVCYELAPFGLFWAHEGKNRVLAYKTLGESCITYELSTRFHYPCPERLTLYRKGYRWWCVLDDDEIVEIQYFARYVAEILRSHGAKMIEGERPPKSFELVKRLQRFM